MTRARNSNVRLALQLAVHAVAIIAVAMLTSRQLFASALNPLPYQLVFYSLVGLTIWRLSGLWLLGVVQAYLLVYEPPQMSEASIFASTVPAGLSLLLVVLACRCKTFLEATGNHAMQPVRQTIQQLKQIDADEMEQLGPTVMKLGWTLSIVLLCLILSATVLSMTPLDPATAGSFRIMPSAFRLIQIGFLLTVTYLVVFVFLTELLWRWITPRQASLFLRSVSLSWLLSDLWAISRSRRKQQRKQMRPSN